MMQLLLALLRDERGQELAEYGIALAIIAVSALAAAIAIGQNVEQAWCSAGTVPPAF
jgi:Flp pilus assembly pilin Flp